MGDLTPNSPSETTSLTANNRRQWWKESVAYQIYPRSFQDSDGDGVGDLRGRRSICLEKEMDE